MTVKEIGENVFIITTDVDDIHAEVENIFTGMCHIIQQIYPKDARLIECILSKTPPELPFIRRAFFYF